MIVLFVERDLGTERGGMLLEKLDRYDAVFNREKEASPLHVGMVVESRRRASAVLRILRTSRHAIALHPGLARHRARAHPRPPSGHLGVAPVRRRADARARAALVRRPLADHHRWLPGRARHPPRARRQASSTRSSSCAGIADSRESLSRPRSRFWHVPRHQPRPGRDHVTTREVAASGPLGERGRREPGTSLSRFPGPRPSTATAHAGARSRDRLGGRRHRPMREPRSQAGRQCHRPRMRADMRGGMRSGYDPTHGFGHESPESILGQR